MSQRQGVWQGLTLAIPARNEEKNLRVLLEQIAAQKYRPERVLVLDDASTDQTPEILKEFSHRYPCTTSDVLFVDADIRFHSSQSLGALADQIEFSGLDFFTVFPRNEVPWDSALLVDQIYTHLYYFLPHNADQLNVSSAVAGCGQMMWAKRDLLVQHSAWSRIRQSTHDGIKLARLHRSHGLKVGFADGSQAFTCLNYKSFSEAFRGFSRNSFEASGSLITVGALSFVLFWAFVMPFVMIPFFLLSPGWLVAFLMILYGQVRVAQECQLGMSHVWLTPVKASASVATHVWGAAKWKLGLGTKWRGRLVTS
jgi:cellulose synthase/poly-beta-1,6-N-acetylglucosamine synthase-like glycosyltransferase